MSNAAAVQAKGSDRSSAQDLNSSATMTEQCAQMDATARTSHGTAFSRSTGLPSHMGKSTEELKTKVPFCVKSDFAALAHSLGLNESELLRSLVMVRLYGLESTERMHSNQLRAAAGMSPLSAPTAVGMP